MAYAWFVLAVYLLVLALPRFCSGDASRIGLLRSEWRQASAVRDSLEEQRRRIMAQSEDLSTHIDSLKMVEVDDEELHPALRSSMVLVQSLVLLDRSLDAARTREDSLLEQLRLGYDWEIGVLIQQLQDRPDEGLLTQLMVYQEAREALGARTSETILNYDEGMAIGPEDGPEEIRQKLELMKDLEENLRSEAHEVSGHLHKLEEEYRLRAAMRSFVGEAYRVEPPPAGSRGALRAAAGAAGSTVATTSLAATLMRGAEGGQLIVVEQLSSDRVLLEIHKCKARQQEIDELIAVVRARAEAFQRHLQEMFEVEPGN